MRRLNPLVFMLLLLCASCGGRQAAGPSQGISNEDLVGSWDTKAVSVHLRSKGGGKKDSTFVLRPSALAEANQTQSPVTFIMADGSYRDEIRSLEGKVIKSNSGFWHLNKDSLYLRMESQGDNESHFGIRKRGKLLELKNGVDWDGDGLKDDEMTIELIKQ